MNTSINFYELKTQLADLGFNEPEVVDQLRTFVLENERGLPDIELTKPASEHEANFTLFFGRGFDGQYELTCIDCSMDHLTQPGVQHMQYFQPDVPAEDAITLLQHDQRYGQQRDPFLPLDLNQTRQYLHADLSIDPRQTDHFDDYDMEKAQHFFELEKQLNALGFNEEALVNALRKQIIERDDAIFTINCKVFDKGNELRTWFEYDQHPGGTYHLRHFECLFSSSGQDINRLFAPDINRDEALGVLQKDLTNDHDIWAEQRPLSRQQVRAYLSIKNEHMNTENLNYLQKQLLNLGFGEQVNADLEKQISAKNKEFTLPAKHDFGGRNVDYQLHFGLGNKPDMYFFNRYDATVKHGSDPEKDKSQTFYINKGNGVTAKEAFNLIEGRAVHKQLFNLEGEKYQAWLHLDKTPQEDGNRKIHTYHENYGYDVEKVLQGKGIKEMDNNQAKDDLLRSLKKGNAQQITVSKDGHDQKYFVSANPQFKTVDLYDEHMKKIKRETLLSPDSKAQSNRQSQKNKQSEEGVPAKKQNRGAKLKA